MCVFRGSSPKPAPKPKPVLGGMAQQVVRGPRAPKMITLPKPVAATPKPKAETPAPKKKSRRFVKSGGMIGGSRGSLQIPTGSSGNLRY